MSSKLLCYFVILDLIMGVIFSLLIFGITSPYLRVVLFFRPIATIPLMLLAFLLMRITSLSSLNISTYLIFLVVVIFGYFFSTILLNILTFRNTNPWWLLNKLHDDLVIYFWAYGPYALAFLIVTFLHFFIFKAKS